jgi:hypothetical protein
VCPAFDLEIRAFLPVVPSAPVIKTFGTIDCGLELMRSSWKTLLHSFSVQDPSLDPSAHLSAPPATTRVKGPCFPFRLLSTTPVDLLVVEQSFVETPPTSLDPTRWERMIQKTTVLSRPKVVLEVWTGNAHLWVHGPACKVVRSRWEEQGYDSRYRRVNATHVGGAIGQVCFICVHILKTSSSSWVWDDMEITVDQPHPMSNLLTPPGLIRSSLFSLSLPHIKPFPSTDPMPSVYGSWIETPRGTRRLQGDELARGLGIPKDWALAPEHCTARLLGETTSVFHWEYLSRSLLRLQD